MTRPAIRVEHLGKQYKLGLREEAKRSFGEAMVHALGAPLRRLQKLSERSDGRDLFWALRNISLQVQPGEVVGIIGPNGAGKSTLLKILSRITAPTTGRVELRGSVRSLLEIGTGFHPELTGRENIYLNGAILGMKKAEIDAHFDQIVAFAEIDRFLDTPVKRYSSGMYIRLAFAVAAHLHPDILIVDEVLAVGDAAFQKKCLGTMRDVATSGRTVLFVSHNMAAISQLCTRAAVLVSGEMICDGTTSEAIKQYLSLGETTGAQVTYEPDETKPMQITSVAIESADGNCAASIDAAEGGRLVIGYRVRVWVPGTYVAIMVTNEAGHDILWSCDATDMDVLRETRPSGDYVARVCVPGRVLVPGTYYGSVGFYHPGRDQSFEYRQRCVCFDAVDHHSLLTRLGIRYPSAVALPLKWETRRAAGSVGVSPASEETLETNVYVTERS
ncbi:MAG: ABC transporter ATP-binding protein [Planctomycetes bacterium]|nr:ABC transporter ATP-binding protein [Planctomycetota bacterium]